MKQWTVSLVLFTLAELLLCIGIANTRRTYQQLFFLPVVFICIYVIENCDTGNATLDYSLGCYISTVIFVASDYLLLTDAQRELRPAKLQGKGHRDITQATFMQRLSWASKLRWNPRGVGWAHEAKCQVGTHLKCNRKTFIASQTRWLIIYAILCDISNVYCRAQPSFARGGPRFPSVQWSWEAWLGRSKSLGFVLGTYGTLGVLHSLCSIISVWLGISEPDEWPPWFGSIFNAYTVRRLWSRTWHQMNRRVLTSHGDFIADKLLHLPRHGIAHTSIRISVAFLVSALLHIGGDCVIGHLRDSQSLPFFTMQVLAIGFEELVMVVMKHVARFPSLNLNLSHPLYKFVGYLWVLGWFTFCVPLWVEPIVHSGAFEDGIRFSILYGVMHGKWMIR